MTKSSFRKKPFILDYGMRRKKSIMVGKVRHGCRSRRSPECSHFHPCTGRKKRTGSETSPYTIKAHPSGRLPPARPSLPKISKDPQTVPPSGDRVFKYKSPWGTFFILTMAVAFTAIRQRGDGTSDR